MTDVKKARQGKRKRSAPSADSATLLLRDIPAAPRFFWKETIEEQYASIGQVKDHNADAFVKDVTASELLALSLNEIAAARRRGFFYHLPSLDQWKKVPGNARMPTEREKESEPSHDYPTMLYANYVWGEDDVAAYHGESQRGRYLLSSVMVNPPTGSTPVYALQYVGYVGCPAFLTSDPSLVIYATKVHSCFFVARTDELRRVLGSQKGERSTRLTTQAALWRPLERDKEVPHEDLWPYRLDSVEQVYGRIVGECCPVQGTLRPSYTVERLLELVPRPDPETARSVGTPLGDDEEHARADGRPGVWHLRNAPRKADHPRRRSDARSQSSDE